jgi:hypothetical protein
VFPVLVDNAGMRSDKLTGLVLLVVFDIAIHTVYFGFLGQHARPGYTHDAVLTHLVFVSLASCRKALTTLASITK